MENQKTQIQKTLYFQYKFPASSNFLMLVVGFGLPLVFVYLALSNQRGLRLQRILTLSTSQATTFYWCAAAVSSAVAVMIVWGVVSRSSAPGTIQLGPTSAVIPAATVRGEFINVPYSAIHRIDVQEIARSKMAVIHSTAGESRLMSSAFATDSQFLTFLQTLKSRVQG